MLLLRSTSFKQPRNAIGSVAIPIRGARGLVENVLHVVTEVRLAIALGIRQGFLGFRQATETPEVLTKQVVRSADIPLSIFGVVHQADVSFERFDGLWKTL